MLINGYSGAKSSSFIKRISFYRILFQKNVIFYLFGTGAINDT